MEIRAVFFVDGVRQADEVVETTEWAAKYVIEGARYALRNPDMAKARLLAGVDELPAEGPAASIGTGGYSRRRGRRG